MKKPIKTKLTTKQQQNLANQMSSNSDKWFTPMWLIQTIKAMWGGIDLDPAADPSNRLQAHLFYTVQLNGLKQKWSHLPNCPKERVFLNPPYGAKSTGDWCNKLMEENPKEAMVLVRNSTETIYFQDLMKWADNMILFKKRIKFEAGAGQSASQPTFGNVMFYRGILSNKLHYHFKNHGMVINL